MFSGTLAQRLKASRKEAGLTQEQLAEKAGVSQQSVQQAEVGRNRSSRSLVLIAMALGVSPIWLQTGKPPKNLAAQVSDGPAVVGSVPLISWVQAGQWSEIVDTYHPGEGEKQIYTTKPVGPRSFALRIHGDSMENPKGKPTYPDGAVVIVDPDKAPKSGDRVVAKLVDSQEATFKVYRLDAGRTLLHALNPLYPPLDVTGQRIVIVGVVVQTWIDEE